MRLKKYIKKLIPFTAGSIIAATLIFIILVFLAIFLIYPLLALLLLFILDTFFHIGWSITTFLACFFTVILLSIFFGSFGGSK